MNPITPFLKRALSGGLPAELVPELRMYHFTEHLAASFNSYLQTIDRSRHAKCRKAYQNLSEALVSLQRRYAEVQTSHETSSRAYAFSSDVEDIVSHLFRLQVVQNNHAFFLQTYSVLSSLIMLVNVCGPRNALPAKARNSVGRFLDHLEGRIGDTRSSDATQSRKIDKLFENLRSAREFREKIDHPQMEKVQDWMTYSTGCEYRFAFFEPAFSLEEVERWQKDIHRDQLVPIPNLGTYHSPGTRQTFVSVKCIVRLVIRKMGALFVS